VRHLRKGDVVRAVGFPGKTRTGELSLFASRVELLSPCLHDVPEVLNNPDTQLRKRHLHMRVNPLLERNLRLRARVVRAVRDALEDRGFVEVETPVLWPIAGGATARPFATHSHALGQTLSLRIATELFLKTLVVGGMERVFDLGKQFRNEGVDATHNPEFTTCEAYMAYQDFDGLVALTEYVVRRAVAAATGGPLRVPRYSGADRASGETCVTDKKESEKEEELDFESPFRRVQFLPALEAAMGSRLPVDLASPAAIDELVSLCAAAGVSTAPPRTAASLLDRLARSASASTHSPITNSPAHWRALTDPPTHPRIDNRSHNHSLSFVSFTMPQSLTRRSLTQPNTALLSTATISSQRLFNRRFSVVIRS
jgi:lysyl-tRNA synthetase class 2